MLTIKISGPVGSGKTTLLRKIADKLTDDGYEVFFRDGEKNYRPWPDSCATTGIPAVRIKTKTTRKK